MKVKELRPGDHVLDERNGATVDFEVVSIKPLGYLFEVTFRSVLGMASAAYHGNAYINAQR
ncbi:hypothetical protein HNQ59_001737 [Chitinivorax tropicus]|uniref:Uncharacterized protein n=1 Tax=Chitinivorax tropicus TaxID=714531 RepID=A0A840MIH2_9PROT|nr:hypothetical protein [Chitinivorax tropicus]MBB5018448.1 hypothetical protein [Chitinivorax tropicus]